MLMLGRMLQTMETITLEMFYGMVAETLLREAREKIQNYSLIVSTGRPTRMDDIFT
jgi:hypothetical protein